MGQELSASAPGQPPCEMVKIPFESFRKWKDSTCNVALIGFMGTGKTTISNALSRITGFKEVDVDQYIVEKEGMAIKDIFAENGEQYFRDLETAGFKEIYRKKKKQLFPVAEELF